MNWDDDKTSKVWAEILQHKFFRAFQKDLYVEDMLTVTANKILEMETILSLIIEKLEETDTNLLANEWHRHFWVECKKILDPLSIKSDNLRSEKP